LLLVIVNDITLWRFKPSPLPATWVNIIGSLMDTTDNEIYLQLTVPMKRNLAARCLGDSRSYLERARPPTLLSLWLDPWLVCVELILRLNSSLFKAHRRYIKLRMGMYWLGSAFLEIKASHVEIEAEIRERLQSLD
jgi:hypothetical protein